MSASTGSPTAPVLRCAGIPITACSRETAAHEVLARAERGEAADVHFCNAYTLALADSDPDLARVLGAATRNYPDGKSVVWANRWLHRDADIPSNRVYGPDIFGDVLGMSQGTGVTHYLLGGDPGTREALEQAIARRYPGARIAGSESPPFRPMTDAERSEQDARIARSGASIVWVGLGTPKQDFEAARLRASVRVVAVAVGAAFDFLAGTKRQAPLWMQDNGLEWLFRLVSEPRRLGRRYLVGNVQFVRAVVRGRP